MMEYLVTMTTHVPDGTSEEAVQDIRSREAARSGRLASQGHLLRLWRPPLQPGEWRSLGLFAADDGSKLEQVLASMPLRVWRTDEVTALLPHPNDPARRNDETRKGGPGPWPPGSEFLTAFAGTAPADTTPGCDADRVGDAAGQGSLERLWALPGEGGTLALWRAPDAAAMHAILASLPLAPWVTVETTPLTPHPSDPARDGLPGVELS